MSPSLLAPNMQAIAQLCQRFSVAKLELFGSAATGDFKPGISDYDFLYEWDPAAISPTAFGLIEFAESLEALLGAHVDLVNPRYIRNPYFKAEVDRTRIPVYPPADADIDSSDLNPAWAAEIERRLTEHERGDTQAIDAAEVFAWARALAR